MSSSNIIIVREYLSSLKEDKELDYLFPLLLNVMGFRIIQTAQESKGQPQYGKDIIAIGSDTSGTKYKWYFELKGYKDRDITERNFLSPDGIRESILAAKDTQFKDSSIPELKDLPIKIVIVHNGILKSNMRPTLDGFISREFKEGEFERWDIYRLTELFSEYLFGEYLLSDKDSNRLLKKTLAFLDAPDNNYYEFQELVELQIEKIKVVKGRGLKKFFATQNLLISLVFHYCKENNNLIAAKTCSANIVLRTWSWILENQLESKESILREFRKLLETQYQVLNAYFKKTYSIASLENGLYAENGAFFEKIGYPIRCFDYLSDLIYYCRLRHYLPGFKQCSPQYDLIKNRQKDHVIELIESNNGFKRPLLDNHSIPILHLFLFFIDKSNRRQKDVDFISRYIFDIVHNILVVKITNKRMPEGLNRIDLLMEFCSSGERPEEYTDDSSMLISLLFELLALFNAKELYANLKGLLDKDLSLQIAHPSLGEFNIEQVMFTKHMDIEYYIESEFSLPDDFEEFKNSVRKKEFKEINYKTDSAGFPFLRTLAHSYFKNENFPVDWRELFQEE